jgi:SAM-dependent methyltransferase
MSTERAPRLSFAGHDMVVESNPETGKRMKFYSRAANTEYWTEFWAEREAEEPYDRALRGHLPFQLRATFRRWVKPAARVLEAGCGLAHFTVACAAQGYRAEGLDWSAKTIQRLRERFPRIPWHVGDVRKLEFDDGVFDALYSPGVCEHFEEGPRQILAETRRVLRPGGIAVISTPCFNPWLQTRSARFCVRGRPSGEFYQYAFTQDGMGRLLERLGFELLQVRPYASLLTMVDYAGWKLPQPGTKPLAVTMDLAVKVFAVAMDYTPAIYREYGTCCIWVARRAD